MLQQYLTPDELANRLKVARSTLAAWRVQKFGPSFIKAGKMVLYAEQDVNQFLESNLHGVNATRSNHE